MPRRSYIVAVALVLTAFAAAIALFVQARSDANAASAAASIERAAETEARALNRVATAEAITGRNEIDAAAMEGSIELLQTLLPNGDRCVTTRTQTETPAQGETPPSRTDTTTTTCEPAIPSDQEVARALARLTGTPVPTASPLYDLANPTYAQSGEDWTVHNQILPISRLLPDVGGEPWQLVLPNGNGIIGGHWGLGDDAPAGDGVHVLTYDDAMTWQEIGISGDVTVGDITHINAGQGIAIDDATTHSPTVKIADEDYDKLQNSLERVLAGTGIDIDNATTNQPTVRLADGTEPFTDADRTKLDSIADGAHALPAYQQSDEEFLSSRAGVLDWEPINEVPIAGTIGHTLTVYGENDEDYRWEATHDATARAANTATQAEVNNNADSIESLNTGQTNLRNSVANIISLPTLPATGERNGKVPQFVDDVLDWHVVTGGGGTDATARASAATNAATIAVNSTDIADNASDIAEQDTSLGELGDKIADLEREFVFEPDYWLATADARTYVVHLNSGEVPDTASEISLTIGGARKTQTVTDGDTDYSFSFTAIDATNIRNNLRGATTITTNLEYRDSIGTLLAIQRDLLRVLEGAPTEVDQTARDAASAAATAAAAAQTTANTNTTNISSIGQRIAAVVRVQSRGANTAASYNAVLDAQEANNTPIILNVTAPITGTRDGVAFRRDANSIFWVRPESDDLTHLFTLPAAGWRPMTPTSPGQYPIRTTDEEFMVEIRPSGGDRRYSNVFAIKAQLSTTPKPISVFVENPDGSADREAGATFTLNAAETVLTVTVISDTGARNGSYAITGVYAK